MDNVMSSMLNKLTIIYVGLKNIFRMVGSTAELKLDAFVFSKRKQPKIRALISGTGLHVVIPLDKMNDSPGFIHRFSSTDQEMIRYVINDAISFSQRLICGTHVKLISKTFNTINKSIMLKIAAFDGNDQNVEFEIDPSELSRNKFLLEYFNKLDLFDIGYAAAEQRSRTERIEIKKAKQSLAGS
jgi:hypothetical protein